MSAGEALIALLVGLAGGAFAGLLGVGGGIIFVPAMVLLLDRDQHLAQGTSLLTIIFVSAVATLINRRARHLDARVAALLSAGGLLGALCGALLALRALDDRTLRRIFGALLVVVATRMLVAPRGAAPRDPAGP